METFAKDCLIGEQKKHKTQSLFVTGRHSAWMIHDHFKSSKTDGTILGLSDVLKVELRHDHLQSFDTDENEKRCHLTRCLPQKKGRTRRLNSSSSVCDDMVTREKTASRDLNLGWEYVIQRSISPHDGVTANARRIKDSY